MYMTHVFTFIYIRVWYHGHRIKETPRDPHPKNFFYIIVQHTVQEVFAHEL